MGIVLCGLLWTSVGIVDIVHLTVAVNGGKNTNYNHSNGEQLRVLKAGTDRPIETARMQVSKE